MTAQPRSTSLARSSSAPTAAAQAATTPKRSIWRAPRSLLSTPGRSSKSRNSQTAAAAIAPSLSADDYSLPLSAVTSGSGDGSWDNYQFDDDYDPLQRQSSSPPLYRNSHRRNMSKISEVSSVEYSLEDSKLYAPEQKGVSRPVSVDISYTSSELAVNNSNSTAAANDLSIEVADTPRRATTGPGRAVVSSKMNKSAATNASAKSNPVSLDVSYTESELDSVASANLIPIRKSSLRGAVALVSPEAAAPSEPATYGVTGALYKGKTSLKGPAGGGGRSTAVDDSLSKILDDSLDDLVRSASSQATQPHRNRSVQKLAVETPVTQPQRSRTLPPPTAVSPVMASPPQPPSENSFERSATTTPHSTTTPLVSNKRVDPALFKDDDRRFVAPMVEEKAPSPILTPAPKQPAQKPDESTTSMATSATTSRTSASSTVLDRHQPHNASIANSIVAAAFQCGGAALDRTVDKGAELVCGDEAKGGGGGGVLRGGSSSYDATTSQETPSSTGDRVMQHPRKQQSTKRPVYLDESSTLRFIRRITTNGFILLYLQPPESGNSEDWNGRTITMTINKGEAERVFPLSSESGNNKGTNGGSSFRPPRLEWVTVAGGRAVESTVTTVDLLDVIAINSDVEELENEYDDDMCFFTVTTGDGDVHVFEAAHVEERDRIVNGLKTVVARLSYHLVVGDTTAVAELFNSHGYVVDTEGELPSLSNPNQKTMNRLAHALMDQGD